MKFNYTIRQLNSPFDDNAIFLRNVYLKKAVLFDCGRLGNLDNSELADISHVLVSHTHMDHFGGFDRFLRGLLNSGNTVRFLGPEGIIDNVEGKLRGYNWNLISDYDLTFEVVELSPLGKKCAHFTAKNSFIKEFSPLNNDLPLLIGDFTILYEFFDHGIPSIGYRLKEPNNVSIIKENLDNLKLKGGAWLKELKKRLVDGEKDGQIEAMTESGVQNFDIKYLEANVVEYRKPQDVTYITDIAPTGDNFRKAVKFADHSNLLIIESVFLEKDAEHAKAKNHLTVNMAKKIFQESGTDFVRFLHFASRYDRFRDEFFTELREGMENKFFPIDSKS